MFWKKRESTPAMPPEELARAIAEGSPPVIIDVRSPLRYREGHLPGSINIPLSELERRASELDPAATTVFY